MIQRDSRIPTETKTDAPVLFGLGYSVACERPH